MMLANITAATVASPSIVRDMPGQIAAGVNTRNRPLLQLGADPEEVHMATRTRNGYWRMSSNRIVQQALTNRL